MSLRRSAAILLATSLAGCSQAPPPPQACTAARVVDLPLLPDAPLPAVQASLAGQKVAIFIDTGAFVSMVSRSAADRFNLRPGPEDGMVRLTGAGGSINAPLVDVRDLGLGRGIARDLHLPVAWSRDGTVPVLGLFGADFFASLNRI